MNDFISQGYCDMVNSNVRNNFCGKCSEKAEFAVGLITCDNEFIYFCGACMKKRTAEIKKMQEGFER